MSRSTIGCPKRKRPLAVTQHGGRIHVCDCMCVVLVQGGVQLTFGSEAKRVVVT